MAGKMMTGLNITTRRALYLGVLVSALGFLACNNSAPQYEREKNGGNQCNDDNGSGSDGYSLAGGVSYEGTIQNHLDQYCVSCHSVGGTGEKYRLDNYEDASQYAGISITSMETGNMPMGGEPVDSSVIEDFEAWRDADFPETEADLADSGDIDEEEGDSEGEEQDSLGPESLLPTYENDIAEILEDNCIRCHGEDSRNGSLATFADASAKGAGIIARTEKTPGETGFMPDGADEKLPLELREKLIAWKFAGFPETAADLPTNGGSGDWSDDEREDADAQGAVDDDC